MGQSSLQRIDLVTQQLLKSGSDIVTDFSEIDVQLSENKRGSQPV